MEPKKNKLQVYAIYEHSEHKDVYLVLLNILYKEHSVTVLEFMAFFKETLNMDCMWYIRKKGFKKKLTRVGYVYNPSTSPIIKLSGHPKGE